MNELDRAIERTIEYGRKFGVEYTGSDLQLRLISSKIFGEKEIVKKLNHLSFFIYHSKEKYVNKKMEKAKRLAEEIGRKFPSVLFVGVTGSVAAGYPKETSDIDLMIITKKDYLWLTRLALRIWVWWKRIPHRRYGAKENKNEFCFNLWLEEDVLSLPRHKQNLRNAMDTILMKPMLNKSNIYEMFLRENQWVKRYVANGYQKKISNLKFQIPNNLLTPHPPLAGGQKFFLNKFLDFFWSSVNMLVFWPQWWYMRRKIGGGLVDRKRAFFHPSNSGV